LDAARLYLLLSATSRRKLPTIDRSWNVHRLNRRLILLLTISRSVPVPQTTHFYAKVRLPFSIAGEILFADFNAQL
jgi:hypothetical protein